MHGPVPAVTATFDEPVGISLDSLRVFAPDGERVDTGGTHEGTTATSIQVTLAAGLAQGTYTVAWHVVSADSHPVQGAFTFSIGHRSRHLTSASLVGNPSGLLSVLYAVDRAAGYLGFVIAAGGAVFLAVCWPDGARHRRAQRLLVSAWLLVVLATLVQLPLQGALTSGGGARAALEPHVLSGAFNGRVGLAVVVRILALAYFAALWLVLGLAPEDLERPSRWRFGGLFVLVTAFAALTWSVPGHSGVGSDWVLAATADVLHVTSAAIWLGGLALLVGVVLQHGVVDAETAGTAVHRFSPLAAWCVLVIAASGAYQAWRNTRSWAALVDTRYGQLLCVKIALLVLLVLLGLQARRVLGGFPFRRDVTSTVDLRRLRRGVVLESVAAVVVLGVTAVLVQSPTARESYHPVASALRTFDTGQVHGSVHAELTPARLGPNRVTLRLLTASGTPYTARQLTATMSQSGAHVGPLPLRLHNVGPGRYVSAPVPLGFRGTWILAVVVRSGPFDETTVTASLPVT